VSKAAPLAIVIARGRCGTVESVVLENGSAPAIMFLDNDLAQLREGRKDQLHKTAKARFMFQFQQMANEGEVSPKRYKSEMNGLCAFRHEVKNSQIRFPCFRDGTKWILTHGFIKPGAKDGLGDWPDSEVRRATEIMAEYWRRKKALSKSAKREKQP
jgi:hypothetical protein